jgi:hypothetical protein
MSAFCINMNVVTLRAAQTGGCTKMLAPSKFFDVDDAHFQGSSVAAKDEALAGLTCVCARVYVFVCIDVCVCVCARAPALCQKPLAAPARTRTCTPKC